MKKFILTLSVMLLLATLTACGGTKDKGNTNGDNGSGAYDKYRAGPYVEMMAAGTYYINGTVYLKGAPSTIKMGVVGESCSAEVLGLENPMRALAINGKMYYVNDEAKKYMMLDSKETSDPKDYGIYNYAGMKFISKGSGIISHLIGIDSKPYDYEEFKAGTGAKAITVRYYFKADKLYAIQFKIGGAGSTMVINQMTKDIPEGLVALPSGYKKVDAAGFFS